MAPDDDEFEDDLYDDEFDFVDDEDSDLDDDSDLDSAVDDADSDIPDSEVEEVKPAPVEPVAKRSNVRQRRLDEDEDSRGAPREEESRDRGPRHQNPRDQNSRGQNSRDQDPRDRDDVPRERDNAPREFDRVDENPPEDEPAEEYRQPEVPANYRVHVYEYGEFKRTIDRPFTAEDAEAFASEYNRTSKSYSRFAIAGKEDVKPKNLLEDAKLPG